MRMNFSCKPITCSSFTARTWICWSNNDAPFLDPAWEKMLTTWIVVLVLYIYAGWVSSYPVNHSIHCVKELKHKYCHCWPLVATFVYYEFSTLSCATKLEKVPHFCTKYSRDWKCSRVISSDDIWALISWHLSFWGCKCQICQELVCSWILTK